MTRLALLGLAHEANTFAPTSVGLTTFEAAGVLRGEEIVQRHAAADTTVAGFLAAAEWPDTEVVPLLYTMPTPAGAIRQDALESLSVEMLTLLDVHGPWDGVLLALHGAAVAEHILDVDGWLLEQVRDRVGPTVVIGAALDLHANVSHKMVEHADVLVTYRTNPHVDAQTRAEETAHLVLGTVRGEFHPVLAYRPVPTVIDILNQNTDCPPMQPILDELDAVLAVPGVLSASVAEGYPYADVPEMGMSVLAVADADPALAESSVDRLAAAVWSRRDQFVSHAATVDEAMRAAADASDTPVLLLDVGDNIGGGAAGDSVVLPRAARLFGVGGMLAVINDGPAAARCHDAGAGACVELSIGGQSDMSGGPPLEVSGVVRTVHDGVYTDDEATHLGQRYFDTGRTAVVESCDDPDTVFVLTSRAEIPSSRAQLRVLGLDPRQFRIVVAKGVHSPLAAYQRTAAAVIQVDTPGVTSADLNRFDYRNRRRPLHPFEPEADHQSVPPR